MKFVLIIGGNGDIGSHMVKAFFEAGYHVDYTYNNRDTDSFSEDKETGKIVSHQLNITKEDEIARLAEKITKQKRILDALIYAVGIFEDSLADKTTLDSWERVIATDLTGAFLCTKHFLPLLRDSGDGRVIYVGSVKGETGCYGSSSYAVCKAGLVGLAKSVALENANKNVTANVLSLGYIDAGMTARVPEKILEGVKKTIPSHVLGDPDDVGRIAVNLCSSHTKYITGQTIRVNGGLYV